MRWYLLFLILGMFFLTPASIARDISFNLCSNSTTLFKYTNSSTNATSWTDNITSTYVNCPFGCDNVNRQCSPASMMSLEGFIILFGITATLIVIGYVFDMWLFVLAGGTLLFFTGIMSWQGIMIDGFVHNAKNNFYIPAFALTLMAMSLYLIYSSVLSVWSRRKEKEL